MTSGTSLTEEPSNSLQRRIISHFWRKEESTIDLGVYDSYFDYYKKTCRALRLGIAGTELESLSIQAHEDLLDMADSIWELSKCATGFDRPQVRAALGRIPLHNGQPVHKINNSINLFLRLWLTIRIQDANFSPAAKTFQWDDTSKIHEFLAQNFLATKSHGTAPGILLESNFTAVNLYRMCGIRVEWTYQLEDHLKYDMENRTISIYSLSQCLRDHLDSSPIFPHGLEEETLLSLSILFPNWNVATERFLQRSQQHQLHETLLDYPSHSHIDQFHYWRVRLLRLHLEFQSPGPSLKHLWTDRRDRLQWYTFWFAVTILTFTFIFGSITIVLTAMQTNYAYESLQLAKKTT